MQELQNNIIREILTLKDTRSLELILDMVKTMQLPDPYILSEGQKKAIAEAEEQITKGETIPHEEVMEKAKQWLLSK